VEAIKDIMLIISLPFIDSMDINKLTYRL